MGRSKADPMKGFNELLQDFKGAGEKPETQPSVVAFFRELEQLQFRFDEIEEIRKQSELPGYVEDNIMEIKTRMKNKEVEVKNEIKSLTSNQSKMDWKLLLHVLKFLLIWFASNWNEDYWLPTIILTVLLILFSKFYPERYEKLCNFFTDSANTKIEGLTSDIRQCQKDMREYINMARELRACRKYDVGTVLVEGTEAADLWSRHFGSDTAVVESSRVVEALLVETDRRIQDHTAAFWDAYARLTIAELEYERRFPEEKYESRCTLEQLFPDRYTIPGPRPNEIAIPPSANALPKLQIELFEVKSKMYIRNRLRALLRVAWYLEDDNDKKALKESLTTAQYLRLENVRQGHLSVIPRRPSNGRIPLLRFDKGVARPGYDKLKNAVTEVGTELATSSASHWWKKVFKETKDRHAEIEIAEVLKIGISFKRVLEIEREFGKRDGKGNQEDEKDCRKKILQAAMNTAVADCRKEAIWLARGDYRRDYLRLETKRNVIHQIVLALGDRTHDGFMSPLEVEQLLLRAGSLDFLMKRLIWSCIHEKKGKGGQGAGNWFLKASAATWYFRPGLKLVSAAETRESMRENGIPGDFAIWPDIKPRRFVFAYVDEKRNMKEVRMENDFKTSCFTLLQSDAKSSCFEASGGRFYALSDIIKTYKEKAVKEMKSILRPFVNPSRGARINISGSRFDVHVGVFLQPVFQDTRLFKKFVSSLKDEKGTERPGDFWKDVNRELRFDRDPTLFNIILNIYRYCGRGGDAQGYTSEPAIGAAAARRACAVIPKGMPSALTEMLRDEFKFWKLPFVLGEGCTVTYNKEAATAIDVEDAGPRQVDDGDNGGDKSDIDDIFLLDGDDDSPVEIYYGDDNDDEILIDSDDEGEHTSSDVESFEVEQSILAGKYAYEALEGLPRFDGESKRGIITAPLITTGQQVEYFSENRKKWFLATVARIEMGGGDGDPTVVVQVGRGEKEVPLGSKRLRVTGGTEGYTPVFC